MPNFILTGPGTNFVTIGDGSTFAEKVIDVSPLLARQLPEFVRSDHPTFVAFLEAYYEWMETDGQTLYESKRGLLNCDIDTTVDDFVTYFRDEFLVDIPENILADKKLLLKHIRQFYRARGTEKSYQLLFRILFDDEADFYYPARDMLRVSDGKWIQDKSLRVSAVTGSPFDLASKQITGAVSQATGIVERVEKHQIGLYTVYELFFSPNSLKGTFLPDEQIQSDASTVAKIYPVVVGINITNGGTGYTNGTAVTITDSSGTSAKAKIKSVDVTTGKAKHIEVTNPGVNYSGSATVTFPTTASTATGTVVLGALFMYPGYYLNEDGQLDTTKFIQDSFFYQQFSYVVLVNESIDMYRDIVKKLLHPCGLILFGGIRSVGFGDLTVAVDSIVTGLIPTVNIVELLIQYFLDLQMNQSIHGAGRLREETFIIYPTWVHDGEYRLGPSLRTLERHKFGYLPSSNYPTENAAIPAPNTNYWLTYGNAQLKDFENIVVGDVIDQPWKKSNICADPYVVITSFPVVSPTFATIALTADFNTDLSAKITIVSGRVTVLQDDRAVTANLTASGGERPYITRDNNQENVILFSEDLSNASWTKNNGTITTNATSNPVTGSATADLFTENNTVGVGRSIVFADQARYTAGQQYEFSGWAKPDGRDWLKIEFDPAAFDNKCYAWYNLTTHSVIAAMSLDYARIQIFPDVPTGWIKFELAFTPTANMLGDVTIHVSNSNTGLTYNGNNTSGVYLWGLQLRDTRSDDVYVATTGLSQFRGVNSFQSLKFMGGQQMSSASTLDVSINNTSQTCHFVFVADNPDQIMGVIASDTNGLWMVYVAAGQVVFALDDGTPRQLSRAIVGGNTHIAKLRHDGINIYFSLDGDQETFVPCGTVPDLTGTISIGGKMSGDYFLGTIARVVTDDSNETQVEQNIVYTLLAQTYDV